ncbi:MAG: hypothetical protein ACRDQD_28165 [Nocardioidaceae bacterium]
MQFEGLDQRTSDGLAQVKAATNESRQQLEERIDRAQVDLNLAKGDAERAAGKAPDETQSKWARMKADASAKMEDIKAKIDKRDEEIDADMAANDADFAEGEASDAIGYAEWVVDNARLAVLDALDARAYAAERSRAAAANP